MFFLGTQSSPVYNTYESQSLDYGSTFVEEESLQCEKSICSINIHICSHFLTNYNLYLYLIKIYIFFLIYNIQDQQSRNYQQKQSGPVIKNSM